MGTIRDAANVTYADGPSSSPSQPRKDGAEGIRALFGTVDEENEARKSEIAAEGASRQEDVAELSAQVDALATQVASGLKAGLDQVDAAQTTALPAYTYANGTDGVGATITADANGALATSYFDDIDDLTDARVFVMLEDADNGIYDVTAVGDGSNPFVLTRATDADTASELGLCVFSVGNGGATKKGITYQCKQAAADITVGTTVLTFRVVTDNSGVAQDISDIQALIEELTDDTDESLHEVHDANGFVAFRVSESEAMIGGLVIRNAGEGVEIHDHYGYILWRAGIEEVAAGAPAYDDQPGSTVPYLGPVLWGVDGETTPIVLENLLKDRADAPFVQATLLPQASVAPASFGHTINVDVGEIGTGATLIVRPRVWDGVASSELRMETRVAANPVSGDAISILGLTDSIATYQGLYHVGQHLTRWGYAPTFAGTTQSEGATAGSLSASYLGECRPGIELRDYTNTLTSSLTPVDIGSEGTYLSANTSTKRTFNPLLVPDDDMTWGPYDPEDVVNGYAVDFDAYFSRFSVTPADVLWLSLLTNDINAMVAEDVFDSAYDETALMVRRWRAHSATKPIVFQMVGTGRTVARDEVWKTRYVEAIRALLKLRADLDDPNFHIVPTYAHVVNDGGYNKTLTSSTPDAITGVITRSIEDAVHPGSDENPQLDSLRSETFRTTAMAIAWANANIT